MPPMNWRPTCDSPLPSGSNRFSPPGARQRQVDVPGRAHAGRREARQEGRRTARLRGDLAREELAERGPVGCGQGGGRLEGDLVLAVAHLALHRLHRDAAGDERPPQLAEQILVAVDAVDGIVGLRAVHRLEVAVALREGLLEGVGEDEELVLDGRPRRVSGGARALDLGAQDVARRHLDAALRRPPQVAQHERHAVEVRGVSQRVEVGHAGRVGPAVLLPDLGEALVHVLLVVVDEDRGRDLDPVGRIEEGLRRNALPHQLALEVGSDDRDGVDRPGVDGSLQLGKGQHEGLWYHGRRCGVKAAAPCWRGQWALK